MPKISDIQETPNPNAVKFILREPVTSGVARQFGSSDQAQTDEHSEAHQHQQHKREGEYRGKRRVTNCDNSAMISCRHARNILP